MDQSQNHTHLPIPNVVSIFFKIGYIPETMSSEDVKFIILHLPETCELWEIVVQRLTFDELLHQVSDLYECDLFYNLLTRLFNLAVTIEDYKKVYDLLPYSCQEDKDTVVRRMTILTTEMFQDWYTIYTSASDSEMKEHAFQKAYALADTFEDLCCLLGSIKSNHLDDYESVVSKVYGLVKGNTSQLLAILRYLNHDHPLVKVIVKKLTSSLKTPEDWDSLDTSELKYQIRDLFSEKRYKLVLKKQSFEECYALLSEYIGAKYPVVYHMYGLANTFENFFFVFQLGLYYRDKRLDELCILSLDKMKALGSFELWQTLRIAIENKEYGGIERFSKHNFIDILYEELAIHASSIDQCIYVLEGNKQYLTKDIVQSLWDKILRYASTFEDWKFILDNLSLRSKYRFFCSEDGHYGDFCVKGKYLTLCRMEFTQGRVELTKEYVVDKLLSLSSTEEHFEFLLNLVPFRSPQYFNLVEALARI